MRRLALSAAVALVLAPILLAAAQPASAADTTSHPFLEKLRGADPDPGQRHPQLPFERACGVAKDSNGYLYVADYYHDAIDVFSSGFFGPEFVTTIPEVDPGNGPCGLAVDSAGDLFVNTWRQDVIKLTPSTYPPTEFSEYGEMTIDASGTATALALDTANGRLYTDDGTYISAYETSTGEPVEEGGQPLRIGLDPLAEYFGLAVRESTGDLYVADAKSDTIKEFEATEAAPLVQEITGAGTPQRGFAYLGDASLALDNTPTSPSYGHLFVTDDIQHGVSENPEAVLDEFNVEGNYRSQIARWIVLEGEPKMPVEYWLTDAEPSGLALSEKGEVLITNGNTEGSVLDVFGPTAPGEQLRVSLAGRGAGSVTSKPAGIACPGACVAEYDEGAEVKLTATPDAHSEFAGWSGEGCTGSEATCRVTMSQAREVSAEFEALPQQNLTVSVEGSGAGTVTSEPAGIECSFGATGTCVEHFNAGSTVTLTAAPAAHTRFKEWVGLACDESAQPICPIAMSEDETITARFEAIPPRQLSISLSGQGTVTSQPTGISCPTSCAASFDEGASVTLTAVPAAHQELLGWSGCAAEPAAGECQVQMSEAEAVTASFGPIHHTLTVRVAGKGTVSADHGQISACTATCSGTYLDGETVTLRAAAAPGYGFAGFSGACGGSGSCLLTLTGDATVTANFAPLPPPPVPPPSPAQLRLGKLTVHGSVATLWLWVSTRGTVTAAGKHLQPTKAITPGPARISLRLALSRSGRRALSGAPKQRLPVPARLLFRPTNGAEAVRAKRTITFGSAGHRHPAKAPHHPSHSSRGQAALTAKGSLFAAFNGGISPAALPRHSLAPIGVTIDAKIRTLSGETLPALRHMVVALNRHGRLDTAGLPVCRAAQIRAASGAKARAVCDRAVVGSGSYVANTTFPEQATFPAHGQILAFNSVVEGHRAILAHIEGSDPVPTTRLVIFRLHRSAGPYGTSLSADLPANINPHGYLKHIKLTLYRRYTVHGVRHSYLSAACPAPAGFSRAPFPFAHTALAFADGRSLSATLVRSCSVKS